MDDSRSWNLATLCELAGVTPRTVRYYVQQGLLPSPGLGAGARYSEAHLARLALIRSLQKEHLPLAEIRRRLAGVDDRTVIRNVEPGVREVSRSAAEYVESVLTEQSIVYGDPSQPLPTAPGPRRRGEVERSQWERVGLSADVEVHVRRPLTREANRRVERLLAAARAIFTEA